MEKVVIQEKKPGTTGIKDIVQADTALIIPVALMTTIQLITMILTTIH
jgi:hypothetical protein